MTDNNDKIHVIVTGGTIDKVYCPYTQGNIFKEESCLPDFFKNRINYDIDDSFTQLMMIDSRDMDNNHRKELLGKIEEIDSNRILITHGTDTMIDTALYIQNNIKDKKKTIVLTGSMVPMDGFYFSDAGFNLGFAMASTQQSNPGIYICMNGQKFTPKTVVKNVRKSRFETVKN